jgi:hypothetical protein
VLIRIVAIYTVSTIVKLDISSCEVHEDGYFEADTNVKMEIAGLPGRISLFLLRGARRAWGRVWFPGWIFVVVAAAAQAQSAANPGVVEVDGPGRYTQVLALSDVHGMYGHLTTLLRGARVIDGKDQWIAGKTLLIVCGDSIDKGPESLPILELWMRMFPRAEASGGRLIVLLGNHEAEFLKDPTRRTTAEFAAELTRARISPQDVAAGRDARGFGKFLLRMPLAARVGKYLFAHAGWYPAHMRWPDFVARAKRLLADGKYGDGLITGEHSILEEKEETAPGSDTPEKWYDDPDAVRSLEARLTAQNLYGVVFGHQPHAFGFKAKIGGVDNLRLIKIDTGMSPDADESDGEILCFKHPTDLLRSAAPDAERLLADGEHSKIKVKSGSDTGD